MRFVVDGDGTVSQRTAKELLRDIASPYVMEDCTFVTLMIPEGERKHIYSESVMRGIDTVLDNFDDLDLAAHNRTPDIWGELSVPGTTFIVVGAETRKHMVEMCLENNIEILDLEKGLYPVKDN